jgi:hypothetical protein
MTRKRTLFLSTDIKTTFIKNHRGPSPAIEGPNGAKGIQSHKQKLFILGGRLLCNILHLVGEVTPGYVVEEIFHRLGTAR